MRIAWDQPGERRYEVGIDRGVLYPSVGDGVAWNGLLSVTERPNGGDAQGYYVDGYKYANVAGPEEYEASIEAFTYPDEFEVYNGVKFLGNGLILTGQKRSSFGLSYRSGIGNDIVGETYGYKIHLIYNVLAAPNNRNYYTLSDDPSAMRFSWDVSSKPVRLIGHRPTPHFIIDSTKTSPPLLSDVEDILYGSGESNPRLPTTTELLELFSGWPTLNVVDNGNGTFTVYGPDNLVQLLDSSRYEFDAESVVDNGDGSFDITSF